jgi:hypothetical protein
MLKSLARLGMLSVLSATLISSSVWGVPPMPTGFNAADATDCGVIRLSWDAVVGASGYNIYRDGLLITIAGPCVTRHLDYEMPGSGAYNYCIEAFDVMGPSPQACDPASLTASPVTVNPWDWYNDVFPSAPDWLVGTLAFDTTTAVLATGHNLAPCVGSWVRAVMPDDKVKITVAGAVLRVDMIFRIEPGPGNYCVVGYKGSGLDVPPGPPCAAAVPGPGSFWGSLMADPGTNATPGAAALHAAAPSGWDKNVWNSRRCEMVAPGVYQTTNFAAPGVDILPDGLFCPGTHIEYYIRVEFVGGTVVNVPDPNCVIQKKVEGSIDGHRWAEFTVLPDRWKDGAWPIADRHAPAPACVLVVDLDDGGGNARAWVAVADSIWATTPDRYGANNGWHAVGGLAGCSNPVDVDDPNNNRQPDGTPGFYPRYDSHGGAAGTTWDLYNVKGAQYNCEGNAGSLGGRAGVVPVGFTPPGPTGAILRGYYRTLILLSGDRSSMILGPLLDRSQNDVGMLQDFLNTQSGSPLPRALIVEGSGFAESEAAYGRSSLLAGSLGASLVSGDYSLYAANPATGIELFSFPPVSPSGKTYGLVNAAPVSNEVLSLNLALPGVVMASKYPDTGINPNPKVASIYAPSTLPNNLMHPSVTLLDGWNIEDLRDQTRTTSAGRLLYHWEVLREINGQIGNCMPVAPGGPVGVGGDRGGDVQAPRIELLGVRGNPLRGGNAVLELGLCEAAHVRVGVYDLAGRMVRVLHDGLLEAGRHDFAWDGTDQAGSLARSGVYLVRARDLDRGAVVGAKLTLLR